MRLDGSDKPRWWRQPSRREAMQEWLRELRDGGPAASFPAQQGLAARQAGLTDWYVKDKRSGRWTTLARVKRTLREGERLLDVVDYGEGLECLTELGRKTLAEWERKAKKTD